MAHLTSDKMAMLNISMSGMCVRISPFFPQQGQTCGMRVRVFSSLHPFRCNGEQIGRDLHRMLSIHVCGTTDWQMRRLTKKRKCLDAFATPLRFKEKLKIVVIFERFKLVRRRLSNVIKHCIRCRENIQYCNFV